MTQNIHVHKFDVLWNSDTSTELVQLLHCKICNKQYWGISGQLGHPKLVHEVKKNVKLVDNLVFNEKVYTNKNNFEEK